MNRFDSKEELYFSWYLNELEEKGILDKWMYHPKEFILSDKVLRQYSQTKNNKTRILSNFLLHPHNYQADFLIYWNNDYHGKIFVNLDSSLNIKNAPFIANKENNYSVIDVKGSYNKHDSYRRFSIEQKWVYSKYKIYVQKIIPVKLFELTFTPERYLFTDMERKSRKLNYNAISLNDYLKIIKSNKLYFS